MKKQYQIDRQRAVQQFRRIATEQNPNIQMILPLADIVAWLQEGTGNLLRHAGLELTQLVMDDEVTALAGDPPSPERPCASLSLRLHQAVKGTFTPELSNMLGTPTKSPRPAPGAFARAAGLLLTGWPGGWLRH